MIDLPTSEDVRSPRFLIMDTTPLSLLACIQALDWLLAPGCDVVITDLVVAEATREPGTDRDQRRTSRGYIAEWIATHQNRLTILKTPEGERYDREMLLWERAGKPQDLRPSWNDRGERSLLQAIKTLRKALETGDELIALVDDRDARDAVRAVRADITLMGTRTFIRWMDEGYSMPGADTAWQTILQMTRNTADPGEDEDPVYIRIGP